MRRILWLDTETTGLSSENHNIIQLAALVEIDGEVIFDFNLEVGPDLNKIDLIDPKATQAHGVTKEVLLERKITQRELYAHFHDMLEQFINPFDIREKFVPAGYNVKFDLNFIRTLFYDHQDKYFGSFITSASLDVMSYVADWSASEGIQRSYKLETMCEYFGISLNAHDALADIHATRELYYELTRQKE